MVDAGSSLYEFFTYAAGVVDNWKKFKMLGLLLGVFCIFALVIYVSLEFFHGCARQDFVGYLCIASLISMVASPLFIMFQNGIGVMLGLVQLLLYAYYSRKSSNTSRLPLLVSG
ncbi:hypothetical protein J5N97_007585 [Dioscorea zingiberensis]|uniref:Uncharacterized protein n=1 Tax=Dioscorea zingiberensis TaxID=325984 RepID=A0A9D5DDF4_9LILI|nr:hypothetical protein J5N97_007585 [Dioscorea zingiberensis]